jgi:hypothetical protein
MLGDGTDSESSRARLARELNGQIRRIGSSLTDPSEANETLTFYRECRCMTEISLSLPQYESSGALIQGHSRPAAG